MIAQDKFSWSPYPYLLILLIPIMPMIGHLLGIDLLFIGVVFAMMPLLDMWMGENHNDFNYNKKEIDFIEKVIFSYLFVHAFIVLGGAYIVSTNETSVSAFLIYACLTGFAACGQGFPVSHEIGHDKVKWKQLGSKIILVFQCYGHYKAEHNRGHHVRAATPEDTVYSKKNVSLYKYLPRAVLNNYVSGCKLEAEYLRKKGINPWSFKNEIVQMYSASLALAILIFITMGWKGLLFFLIQAVFSVFILETVEYVQHYGLTRKKLADGKYERMGPEHSWNSAHMFSNYTTLNLQRHPDHHANPGKLYHELVSHKESPQLPLGYHVMVGMAMIPPLWFKVMNPKLEAYLDKGNDGFVENKEGLSTSV